MTKNIETGFDYYDNHDEIVADVIKIAQDRDTKPTAMAFAFVNACLKG